MRKGKFGIILNFYPVLAFILAFLGNVTPSILLLGFVLVAEKDEWATKQTLQAFVLTIANSLVSNLWSTIGAFFDLAIFGRIFDGLLSVVSSILSIVIFIFIIVGLTKSIRGENANIPLLQKFANWAYGVVQKKVYTPYPHVPPTGHVPPQNPHYGTPPAQPVHHQQPPVQNQHPIQHQQPVPPTSTDQQNNQPPNPLG